MSFGGRDEDREKEHATIAQFVGQRRKQKNKILLLTVSEVVQTYAETYLNKTPCRTSALFGMNWVTELLNSNPTRIHQEFRMNKHVFLKLCDELVNIYGFCITPHESFIRVEESVGIFLFILGGGTKIRGAEERFQHSGETIHRHFDAVLEAMKSLTVDYCKPTRDQNDIHPYIENNQKYRVFKDCIGAIDGTHVVVRPKPRKFYLVDAGYPNTKGFMSPYRGQRYHQEIFCQGEPPRNAEEMFNQVHSSLISVIERMFGVWKMRWRILRDMPSYDLRKQIDVIGTSMALHNFTRKHNANFPDPEYDDVMLNGYVEEWGSTSQDNTHDVDVLNDDDYMKFCRNEIRDRICRNMRNRSR